MISNVFLDSSVLVEAMKGRHVQFLDSFLANNNYNCFINETVISEFLFHVLGTNGGVSPKTLQQGGKVPATLILNPAYAGIFRYVHFLQTDASLFTEVPRLMIQYNLLPNDAIIIATCLYHNIHFLAAHDADFVSACVGEGITLLNDAPAV
ncbi:MAG: PIN domain-containing protein [Bacteroidota bacterium]